MVQCFVKIVFTSRERVFGNYLMCVSMQVATFGRRRLTFEETDNERAPSPDLLCAHEDVMRDVTEDEVEYAAQVITPKKRRTREATPPTSGSYWETEPQAGFTKGSRQLRTRQSKNGR